MKENGYDWIKIERDLWEKRIICSQYECKKIEKVYWLALMKMIYEPNNFLNELKLYY